MSGDWKLETIYKNSGYIDHKAYFTSFQSIQLKGAFTAIKYRKLVRCF